MSFDIQKSMGEPHTLELYPQDCVIKRTCFLLPDYSNKPPNKKAITKLTEGSLKRLAFFASNTAQSFNQMITLTYPSEFSDDGAEVKRHLNLFLTRLRKVAKGVKYLWFLEFQERGAPHFHILISIKWLNWQWVANTWYEIVNSDDKKHLAAGAWCELVRKKRGARHYAVKYATKCKQKNVPKNYQNVGRFWGHSKGIEPKVIRTIELLGYADLQYCLREWKYVHKLTHQTIVSVLYNATQHVLY